MVLFQLTGFGLLCSVLTRICPSHLRWLFLLVMSLLFYASRGSHALILLMTLSLWIWGIALVLEKEDRTFTAQRAVLTAQERKEHKKRHDKRRRILLLFALLFPLAMLSVFKYTNEIRAWVGLGPLGLLLPFGISFYTFQAIGYLLDVYGGKAQAEKNPFRLCLFLVYFPQLIQGPIGRNNDLSVQLYNPPAVTFNDFARGSLLIFWGLMKKLIIADRAAPAVNAAFSGPIQGGTAIAGVLLYSLQQYCDFSGGIDLVSGIAECMGIRLAENFRRPYFSVSLADFWRRWHISLGSWMRDYVFYPFALSKPVQRLSKMVKSRMGKEFSRSLPAALGNLMVFSLVGLWHGASSHYLAWGLYNGIILAVSALLEPAYKRWTDTHAALSASKGMKLWRIIRTFTIVNVGWFFDRCTTSSQAFSMILSPLTSPVFHGTWTTLDLPVPDLVVLFIMTFLLFSASLAAERGHDLRSFVLSRPLPLRFLIVLSAIMAIVIFGVWGSGFSEASFIYNQI